MIKRFGLDGILKDSIILPKPKLVEVTFERVYQVFGKFILRRVPAEEANDTARLKAELQSRWAEAQAEAAKVFPEYADLQCDGSSRLWIQPYDLENRDLGRGPVWRQPDPTGGKVLRLPNNFLPKKFAKDRIWGLVRDENDVPSIAWVKLP